VTADRDTRPRVAPDQPEWDIEDEEGGSTVRPRTLLLFALAPLIGAAISVPPALAAPSEAKLEVNENCVQSSWPCWATPGSGSNPEPASKVTIASGGTVVFVDHGKEANLAWTGTAPTCEPSVPVAPAAPTTGWEGKCTFATPGTYIFESSTLFNGGSDGPYGNENYTKYEVLVEATRVAPPPKEPPTKEPPAKEPLAKELTTEPSTTEPPATEPAPTPTAPIDSPIITTSMQSPAPLQSATTAPPDHLDGSDQALDTTVTPLNSPKDPRTSRQTPQHSEEP
jgi:hypothetical protein